MSRCKACGAEIIWIKIERTGKPMPCDAAPIPYRPGAGGNLTLVTTDGRIVHGTRDSGNKSAPWGYQSHFASCPAAARFRKRGGTE